MDPDAATAPARRARIPLHDTDGLSRTERTRMLLCRAAERIVAESGPTALTMRAAAVRAGQRNTNAVIYHFGDAASLMWHTIEARAHQMEQKRARLLDQATADGKTDDLETLFRCLGMPIIAIVDENGDHIFARFLLQLFANQHPYSFLLEEVISAEFPARSRLLTLLLRRLDHIPSDRLRYLIPALTMMPLHAVTARDLDRKAGRPTPSLEALCDSSYRMLAASVAGG